LEVVRAQTAVTGVQPKLSLNIIKEGMGSQKRFTIVGVWGRYILKPQTAHYPHLPENEDLTMHLAKIVGIKTVPHSLVRFQDGSLAYLTKRIDRDTKGRKIPMEDMCQLTGKLTEQKYRGSHEQIAKIIVAYSAYPILDIINYFEVLLFCYLTGNADAHLKNFSLYKHREGHILTPAYDLVSTKMVVPQDTEELALSLNGKQRKLNRNDFEGILKAVKVEKRVMENIYLKFLQAIPQWQAFIERSFLPHAMKEAYRLMVQERAKIIDS
jgi:serine/threonine-protein kinase HipA